jgi:hypothetical protein
MMPKFLGRVKRRGSAQLLPANNSRQRMEERDRLGF